MSTLARLGLICFCLSCPFAPLGAQPFDQEVRGIWLTNVDSDVLASKASIADAMDFLATRGFNVVFPVVWNKGYTQYPSAVMDSLFGKRQDPFFEAQERDPLAELIVEAHRNGMEVIPWFEFGFATSFSQAGGHIIDTKPDWAAQDINGNLLVRNGFDWMNALHPEVQDFMLALFREVIESYDVDGVQGDDRLPAMPVEGGYSAYTTSLYRDLNNGQDPPQNNLDPAWIQWRADQLTSFAGRLYRMVKGHNEDLIVSMAPSVWPWSRENYLQDWPAWLDSGYVDMVHPQVYRWDLSSYQNEIRRMFGQPGVMSGYVSADQVPSVSPGMIIKSGSRFNPPATVAQMTAFHRQYQSAGEVFFFYEGLGSQNAFLADSLASTFYSNPAILPGRNEQWRPLPPFASATDATVTRTGTWTPDPFADGFQQPALVANAGETASLTYTLESPYTASYEVYTYIPPQRAAASDSVTYLLNTTTENAVYVINQQEVTASGWMNIGTVSLDAGERLTIELQTDPDASAATYADAMMLLLNRAASPDLVIDIALTDVAKTIEPPKGLTGGTPFPNPIRTSATIPFELPASTRVNIILYDILGRRVQALLPETVLPAGPHTVPFNRNGLAAGLYFFQINTPAASSIGKLLVVD